MRWSIKIAKVAGIEVRVHLTFLLLLAWIGVSYYRSGGGAAAVSGITLLLLIFLCVLLHEFGHAMAAKAFGIQTPDITLLPIGGVARLQRMPDDPRQELIVAAAGPMVNVVIASLLFLLPEVRQGWNQVGNLGDPGGSLAAKVAVVNVVLVVFNLIPAFPMDGGRMLRAVLAMGMSHSQATLIAARIGQALAFAFGFLGLFGNPMLIFIALFVYLGASQENAMAQMKDVTSGVHVADAMVTELTTLRETDTIDAAIEALLRTSQVEFPVLDSNDQILGILTRESMIHALRSGGRDTPVKEAMRTCDITVHPRDNFEEAFRLMQESNCPALPVVDDGGQLIGLITPENVGELMMVRSVLGVGELPAWKQRE